MTTANTVGSASLLDLVKRTNPDGSVAQDIVEYLTPLMPILEDSKWKTGNLPTGELVTSRTGLPAGSWRRLNEGVSSEKSTTGQYVETTGMLESFSTPDAKIVDLNGGAGYRASEDKAFAVGMGSTLETAFVYASTKTAPEQIMGLAPRFDATTNPGGAQILLGDSGAAGADQTSIWLVGWGDQTVYGIVPKGIPAGLQIEDRGRREWFDANNKPYMAYVTHFEWNVGLCVKDWRYVVRIANVDTGNLTKDAASGTDVVDMMIQAYHQMNEVRTVSPAYYVNRKVSTFLHRQARNAVKQSTLSIDMVAGKPVLFCMGIPVRTSDAITNTESPVS